MNSATDLRSRAGRVLGWLNWWAFTGCLVWPRGMTWRAKFPPTRWLFLMFFRHVTRPFYDWWRR